MQHLNYVNKHVNNAVSPRGRALLVHVTCLRRAEAGHDQRALGLALAEHVVDLDVAKALGGTNRPGVLSKLKYQT